jgi:hypothetical protein
MSEFSLNAAAVSVDEAGRVILGDVELDAICNDALLVTAGGDGPGSTNTGTCTNDGNCSGSRNTSCTNVAICSGATNGSCPRGTHPGF